ncbi:hypothetical protein [Macrococcoides canis]|uniref:hypothetical protein n=1 Tax=Macrococcoides canis TaxID=1855823 RepID=UPI001061DBC7|nr:hypothetical protein [Macrococcus canis]TDM34396.1 hypothetical protein ETI13_01030 [Macrococcus canis]
MKKILMISMDNIFATPYIEKYLNNIDKETIEVVFWNRKEIEEEIEGISKIYEFKNSSKGTIKNYIKFYLFLKKILKNNKYGKIILLHSPLNILLTKELLKFNKSYIIDIRDFTMEDNRIYSLIQSFNIKRSFATVISSEGYLEFLPNNNYVICHNSFNGNIQALNKPNLNTIIITQVGVIRFLEKSKELINSLANNEKFLLKFIGSGANKIEIKDKIKNVYVEDYFDSSETIKKYSDATLINNCYGSVDKNVKYALSNKLYIACTLKRPILVSNSTYLSQLVEENGLGLSIETRDNRNAEKIENYICNLDWEKFYRNCDIFMQKVKRDDEKFFNMLKRFEEL